MRFIRIIADWILQLLYAEKVKFNDKLNSILFLAWLEDLFCIFLVALSFVTTQATAQTPVKNSAEVDRALAEKLRSDLQYDVNRRKAFSQHTGENKIYDQEREKGLALFLEEEERWNRLRDKESRGHAKTRPAPQDEFSPEYKADLKEKEAAEKQRELDRGRHVRTKSNLFIEFEDKIPQSEEKELGIAQERPRYELRKRAKNKWVNSGKTLQGGGGGSSGSSPFDSPSISSPSPGDFVAPPMDTNFEDIPPPPPPIPYDNFDQSGAGGFDSGFGDVPPPPPPPPNDPSWDF